MMIRRALLLFLPLIAACSGEEAPPPRADSVTPALEELAQKVAPGTLAVAMRDLATNETRGINRDKAMPMQSVFKLPLGIVVLDKVDKGELSLDDKVTLTRESLSLAHSPIAADFDRKKVYTIGELLRAAIAQSDNTAADILMEKVGGPAAVTSFFKERGIENFRVDRYERELQPQIVGLPEFEGQWIGWDEFEKAQNEVQIESQRAAFRLHQADPRDRISAGAAVDMLAMLAEGRLLSPESTERVMDIMKSTTTGADRLKAGVPSSSTIYHKTGTGPDVDGVNSASNDIGIVELTDGRRIAIAAFLSDSTLSSKERAAVIAEVGRIATQEFAGTAPVR